MNKERRKAVANAIAKLHDLKEDLESITTEIADAHDGEQEAYDNLPEGLQQGEKGEAMSAAVTALEEATEKLETMTEDLDDAVTSLEEIEQ